MHPKNQRPQRSKKRPQRLPRQGRLNAPGTLHHVMIWRIDALEIFRDDQDREDCLSRIPQLVGSISKNIRLIAYGDYVHVHNKYLHLAHYQDHEEAGNREKKVIVINNVPQNCLAATFFGSDYFMAYSFPSCDPTYTVPSATTGEEVIVFSVRISQSLFPLIALRA